MTEECSPPLYSEWSGLSNNMKRLIIKFKNGTQASIVVADHFSREQAFEIFKRDNSPSIDEIVSYAFEAPDPNEELRVAFIKLKNNKTLEIRTIRDFFLKNLDVPFMMALESQDNEFKSYIISLKNFLRDVPRNSMLKDIKDPNEIARYNPFNNIFYVSLTGQGDGYVDPPTVTIEPPIGPYFGYQAKAIAFIKNGKVSKIEVVDKGCGYISAPNVTISAPVSGVTAQAVCQSIENAL